MDNMFKSPRKMAVDIPLKSPIKEKSMTLTSTRHHTEYDYMAHRR